MKMLISTFLYLITHCVLTQTNPNEDSVMVEIRRNEINSNNNNGVKWYLKNPDEVVQSVSLIKNCKRLLTVYSYSQVKYAQLLDKEDSKSLLYFCKKLIQPKDTFKKNNNNYQNYEESEKAKKPSFAPFKWGKRDDESVELENDSDEFDDSHEGNKRYDLRSGIPFRWG
jgi:hypothetical protein